MSKKRTIWGGDHFPLWLKLELAVMLPAAALILINFYQLKSFERDKVLEAAIHRDFQQMLYISEKKINEHAYMMAEDYAATFPSPDAPESEKAAKLKLLLTNNPCLAHAFIYDSKAGFLFKSQPARMNDPRFEWEHERLAETYGGWLGMEGSMIAQEVQKKKRPVKWYSSPIKRGGHEVFMNTAFLHLPDTPADRAVVAGVILEPDYLRKTFFPELLNDLVTHKLADGGNPLALTVYPTESEGKYPEKFLATSIGWSEGKPEVARNLDDVFRGLTLGIRFQGVTADELSGRWVHRSFLILGVLSLVLIGGLVLTYRSVKKEMALAKLKSDFVSNVSHELRTPLSLIRLYAETLELGRVQAREKVQEYYGIIRKESERLTALINNILDFSRIEAGRKEYEFRETDIAELVHNTLESYRDQIQQQGFAFEERIDSGLPAVYVDREAIARSLVNLVNNALKYSADEKFVGVNLYRANGSVKLEVVDRGIGIARHEQSKIFEKFYRAGDPLVHNTKGSGLGLSLVRHIVTAHGGQVEVESAPGRGSKFTLSLPLADANRADAAASRMGAA